MNVKRPRRNGLPFVNLLVGCVEGTRTFGVSLSFVDSDSNGQLVPSRLAGPYERTDIAAALTQVGRGMVRYTSLGSCGPRDT